MKIFPTLCLLTLTLTASAQTELLSNRGFETGTFTNWYTFGQGWRTGGGGDAHSGLYGAINDVLTSDGEEWRGLVQTVPVLQGETYVASVYIHTLNVEDSASYLEVQWLDNAGALISQISSSHVTNDQPFTQALLDDMIAPMGAVTASVRGVVHMISTPTSDTDFHIFDDFSFVQLPPNPVTNRSFETGDLSGWNTFGQGWRTGGGDDAHSGVVGAVNDVSTNDVDDWRGIYQNLPVVTGKTYSASVYIRTLNIESSASWLEIQWLDINSNMISQVQSASVTNNQPFTLMELPDLSPPTNALYASLRGVVFMETRPTADMDFHVFDDFSFGPASDPVPIPLHITATNGPIITLDWEQTVDTYVLEYIHDLNGTNWLPSTQVVSSASGRWVVTYPTDEIQTSFRLKGQ